MMFICKLEEIYMTCKPNFNCRIIRLGATPSGLSRAHLYHPPIFYQAGCPSCHPTNCESTEGNFLYNCAADDNHSMDTECSAGVMVILIVPYDNSECSINLTTSGLYCKLTLCVSAALLRILCTPYKNSNVAIHSAHTLQKAPRSKTL